MSHLYFFKRHAVSNICIDAGVSIALFTIDKNVFMSIPLLICDDSLMARKQVARSLPEGWDVTISYATNGVEGLQAIRDGKGEMVFLDLTMPDVDGYQVLETIRAEGLNAMVIVISGDIQPTAHLRVSQLGAIDFIQKPVNPEKLTQTLKKFGLI